MNVASSGSLRLAALAFAAWIFAAALGGVAGVDTASCVALGLVAWTLLGLERFAAADSRVLAFASVLSAVAVAVVAWKSTRAPVIVQPRYMHGGDGEFAIVGVVFDGVIMASCSSALAYTLAHPLVRHGEPALLPASRVLAVIATIGLALLLVVALVRSSHASPPDDWARAQPLVIDVDDHASWVADPDSTKGESRKHTTIEHGITMHASCSDSGGCRHRVVFPSGVEASVFALYDVVAIRHAPVERLWLLYAERGGSPAVFEDDGRPAGDLHLQRIAGSVAPPRSHRLLLLVGLAISIVNLARARLRDAKPTATGSGPYREATVIPSVATTMPLHAETAAIACLACAPTLGWWIGVLR